MRVAGRTRPSRAAWWCFAAALLLFALAEITWSALYSGGGDVPSPNPTDVLYLSTYPLFMAGLVLMVRARVLDVPWHRWLDGFVLVLIVATPGVLLLIEPVLENAPIDLLGQIVAVAYPLGDVLLLGALLGSLPLLSWRLAGSWPWVGVGLVCFTVADAAYSLTAADVVAHDGPYDFLWSAGALAFAVGATRLPSPARPSREITGWPAIVLPLGAQLFAVATQVYGWFWPLPAAERLLTIAVLVIGIAQIIVSRPRPRATATASSPPARSARTSPGAGPRRPRAERLAASPTPMIGVECLGARRLICGYYYEDWGDVSGLAASSHARPYFCCIELVRPRHSLGRSDCCSLTGSATTLSSPRDDPRHAREPAA